MFGQSENSDDFGGGWMTALADAVAIQDNINLSICFPLEGKSVLKEIYNNIDFYSIPVSLSSLTEYNKTIEDYMSRIAGLAKPDLVHIHGTEYIHGLALMNVRPDLKYIISIQGVVTACAQHYTGGLPIEALRLRTLKDIVMRKSVLQSKKTFERLSLYEEQILNKANAVIGRTAFDKAAALRINPNIKYYHCGEILRDSFYNNKWSFQNCIKHTIFISQGSYPLKGLHFALEAMPIVLKEYSDTKLIIAGYDITKTNSLKDKLKLSGYGKYLKRLIEKYKLENNMEFTGVLNEKQICERLKSSHIYVLPSAVENSSNSLGEAMLMGVPCVASNTGGTPSMLKHGEEGFLYQYDDPYMLANYILRLFSDNNLCKAFSAKATEHAAKSYDRELNIKTMLKIYEESIQKSI